MPKASGPWKRWLTLLEDVVSSLPKSNGRERTDVDGPIARALVQIVKDAGFRNHECQVRFFEIAQDAGLHVMRNHFYSPVPDTSALDDALWQSRADADGSLDLREPEQLELLEALSAYSHELDDVPEASDGSTSYFWRNPAFWSGDGAVYYSMIRHFGARRIIEVGSGFSTRLSSRAALLNDAELTCIEPFPMESLRAPLPGLSRLIESPVQEVPLEEFDRLERNDVLFIDSTHVSKIGSDVNHLLLRVVPRLKPGVLIHVHDIFLPWEMPRAWVLEKKIFWNEQYLLQAMLTSNPTYEVLLGNQFLGRQQPDAFRQAFPCIPKGIAPGGVSFWFRRKAIRGR